MGLKKRATPAASSLSTTFTGGGRAQHEHRYATRSRTKKPHGTRSPTKKPQTFMDLPLELRDQTYEEEWSGPCARQRLSLNFNVPSSHETSLMVASKQVRAEAIRLVYSTGRMDKFVTEIRSLDFALFTRRLSRLTGAGVKVLSRIGIIVHKFNKHDMENVIVLVKFIAHTGLDLRSKSPQNLL